MSTAPRILLLLIALSLPSSAQTPISGRLLGSDGRAMSIAHLHLMTESGLSIIEAKKDGSFATTIDRLGAVRLYFTGADHQAHSLHLYLEKPDQIELDVRLAAHDLETTFDQVAVIGSFNGFDFNRPLQMEPDGAGRWSVDVPCSGDSLEYQLLGVARGRSINGMTSERMRPDDGGDYISIVRCSGGSARIVFESARVVRGAPAPELTLRKAAHRTRASIARYDEYRKEIAAHRAALAGVPELPEDTARYVMKSWLERTHADLTERIASSSDTWDRQLLYASWYDLTPALLTVGRPFSHHHPAPLPLLPEVVPASSPIWIDAPDALATAIFHDTSATYRTSIFSYVEHVASNYPVRRIRVKVARDFLETGSSLPAEWLRSMYTLLKRDDPDGRDLREIHMRYGNQPLFLRARSVPHSRFSGVVLDSSGAPVANATVSIVNDNGMDTENRTKSDAEGRFELPISRYGILPLSIKSPIVAMHRTDFYIDRPTTADVVIRLTGQVDSLRFYPMASVARIEIVTPGSPLAEVTRLLQYLRERRSQVRAEERMEAARRGGAAPPPYDPIPGRDSLLMLLAQTKDTLARQLRLLDYIYRVGNLKKVPRDSALWYRRDSLSIAALIAEVPPTSYLWHFHGQLPMFFQMAAGRNWSSLEVADYMERLASEHPDPELRSEVLFYIASNISIDSKKHPHLAESVRRGHRAMARLLDLYPESHWAQQARRRLSPDRPIQKGRAVPAFAWRAIDNDSVVHTPASMRGKYYLIDFWATWCGPCIAEMEPLHKAYEKFHERGFEILSISYDGSPEDVRKFRGKKWSMPWLHTFAQGGFGSQAGKLFDVSGVPRTVLVGPDGVILAVDLRGEQLGAFLEKTLAIQR